MPSAWTQTRCRASRPACISPGTCGDAGGPISTIAFSCVAREPRAWPVKRHSQLPVRGSRISVSAWQGQPPPGSCASSSGQPEERTGAGAVPSSEARHTDADKAAATRAAGCREEGGKGAAGVGDPLAAGAFMAPNILYKNTVIKLFRGLPSSATNAVSRLPARPADRPANRAHRPGHGVAPTPANRQQLVLHETSDAAPLQPARTPAIAVWQASAAARG